MDPIIGASAIMAATQLLGGILGQQSAAEQQKKSTLSQIGQQQTQMEMAGIQQAMQGQQGALANLIEAYRSSLLG